MRRFLDPWRAPASRRLFGDANPVGRKLALTGIGPAEVEVWTTIVGVAGDAHLRDDPTAPKEAVVYRPFAQARPFVVQVVARVGKRTNAIDQELRAAVAPLAAGSRNRWAVAFLEDDVDKYLATPRFTASSVSGLAALGLFLLLVGVFGVTATSVSLRTREIAIREMGPSRRSVFRPSPRIANAAKRSHPPLAAYALWRVHHQTPTSTAMRSTTS